MVGGAFSKFRMAMAVLAFCMGFLLPASPALAAMTDLTPCVAPVQSGDSLPTVLANTQRFDCRTPQSSLPAGDYWVRMDVPPAAREQELRPILRVASLWDNGFTMSAIHADGSVSEYDAELMKRIAAMRLGPSIVLPLDANKPPIKTVIARVNGSQIIRGVMLAPQISNPDDSMRYEMAMGATYAAFGGLCIAMVVYTLALWRAMRQRFLLAYCAMVLAMASYAFFTTGAVHYVIDGMTGSDRLRITIPLLAIAGSTALIFVRYFFAATVIPTWLVRATFVQAIAMSVFAISYSLIAPAFIRPLDQIYMIGFLPIPFFMFAYAWTAWKQKDPFLKYFIVAWSAPLLSVAIRMLHSVGMLPYNLLIENSTLIAFAFEALVNSLAVGRRVWLLAQARDRAENAEANAMVMADTDPLTGLLNRRAFLRKILDIRSNWTLVLLDVDHFKRVNDTLGHAGGDDAIIDIAAAMRANAPEGALVARMGGEEFAISYRSDLSSLLDPRDLLEDVRSIKLPGGYRITASVGIANRQVNDENDWKILYRAADMALYNAKEQGRDCYRRFVPERVAA